jgi:ribosomal protein L18E
LSGGELTKKVTVAAYAFSKTTQEKLGTSLITIEEAMKKYPKGNNLKIIG